MCYSLITIKLPSRVRKLNSYYLIEGRGFSKSYLLNPTFINGLNYTLSPHIQPIFLPHGLNLWRKVVQDFGSNTWLMQTVKSCILSKLLYFATILFRHKYVWYQLIYDEEALAPVRSITRGKIYSPRSLLANLNLIRPRTWFVLRLNWCEQCENKW